MNAAVSVFQTAELFEKIVEYLSGDDFISLLLITQRNFYLYLGFEVNAENFILQCEKSQNDFCQKVFKNFKIFRKESRLNLRHTSSPEDGNWSHNYFIDLYGFLSGLSARENDGFDWQQRKLTSDTLPLYWYDMLTDKFAESAAVVKLLFAHWDLFKSCLHIIPKWNYKTIKTCEQAYFLQLLIEFPIGIIRRFGLEVRRIAKKENPAVGVYTTCQDFLEEYVEIRADFVFIQQRLWKNKK